MITRVLISAVLVCTAAFCYECSDGYFGDTCKWECHCNVSTEVCDKQNGYCHSGCAEGWTGPSCQAPKKDEDEHRYSVLGLAMVGGILALLSAVAFACYCMGKSSRKRNSVRHADRRQQRRVMIQQFFHNYSMTTSNGQRRSITALPKMSSFPGLPGYFEPVYSSNTSAPPSYSCVISMSHPAADSAPARPETPPPPYDSTHEGNSNSRRPSTQSLLSHSDSRRSSTTALIGNSNSRKGSTQSIPPDTVPPCASPVAGNSNLRRSSTQPLLSNPRRPSIHSAAQIPNLNTRRGSTPSTPSQSVPIWTLT